MRRTPATAPTPAPPLSARLVPASHARAACRKQKKKGIYREIIHVMHVNLHTAPMRSALPLWLLVRFLFVVRRHLAWPCRRWHLTTFRVGCARSPPCALPPWDPAWRWYARLLHGKSSSYWCRHVTTVAGATSLGFSQRHGQRVRVAVSAHPAQRAAGTLYAPVDRGAGVVT
jgi:hypothetical protein